MIDIDISDLKQLISCDTETGLLTWLERPRKYCPSDGDWKRWNSTYAGKPAFTSADSTGYFRSRILGKSYTASRVIWALSKGSWPPDEIDHRDRDRKNNKLKNLRLATSSQNALNRGVRIDNKAGCVGVNWHKGSGKWHARITVDRKRVFLGAFADVRLAIEARMAADA